METKKATVGRESKVLSGETPHNRYYDPQPLLIIISGPSGVGKDAVLKRLKERNLPLYFVVTATTRPAREGEVDGVDYYFVSHEEFTRLIDNDELLEHTLVYTDYKGIPKSQVRQGLATGKDVILRIDVQGAATVRALCPESVLIFLMPASEEELTKRLTGRNSESEESLRVRLNTFANEMERLPEFDYLVINTQGHLDDAVDTIVAIIQAEHHRVVHRRICL